MAYCTITEVRGLNPKRTYSASTNPSTTEVEEFIDRISDEIDVILQGRGFTTPVTSPTELASYLVHVNAYGAAAIAEQSMFTEPIGPGATPHGTVLWQQYQQALKYLREGQLPVTTGAHPLPFSFHEQNLGNATEPKEDDEWRNPKFGINKEF